MTEPHATAVDLEAIEAARAAATGAHDAACRAGLTSNTMCPACDALRHVGGQTGAWLSALISEVRQLRGIAAAYSDLQRDYDPAHALLADSSGHLGKRWTEALCDEVRWLREVRHLLADQLARCDGNRVAALARAARLEVVLARLRVACDEPMGSESDFPAAIRATDRILKGHRVD